VEEVKVKFKIALIAVIVAGFMASFAVAASPNKGGANDQSTTTTAKVKKAKRTCRPNVSLILRGKLVSVAEPSLTMLVKQTNKHARSYKGKEVVILTDNHTKILRLGHKVTLSALVVDDGLNVQARACKRGEAPASPLAVRVVAKPAAS
jgi:hypothetical protein